MTFFALDWTSFVFIAVAIFVIWRLRFVLNLPAADWPTMRPAILRQSQRVWYVLLWIIVFLGMLLLITHFQSPPVGLKYGQRVHAAIG